MIKYTRYQGAIVRNHRLLLLQQAHRPTGRTYWVIPGGRIESDETEVQCVKREMLEETGLHVEVGELLLDESSSSGAIGRRKTYLCSTSTGEPSPGYEPEADAIDFTFTDVQWIDLRFPEDWPDDITSDPITYPMLQRIRLALGYAAGARGWPAKFD